jgi:hypothetical protein
VDKCEREKLEVLRAMIVLLVRPLYERSAPLASCPDGDPLAFSLDLPPLPPSSLGPVFPTSHQNDNLTPQ